MFSCARPSDRVRADARFVIESSKHVKINEAAIERSVFDFSRWQIVMSSRTATEIAELFEIKAFSIEQWREHELHPSNPLDTHADWLNPA